MDATFLLYAVPAALAFFCKIYFLRRLSLRSHLSKAFAVLCVVMVLQNATEVIGYWGMVYSPAVARWTADAYMLCTYALGSALLYFCCTTARIHKPALPLGLCLMSAVLMAMHLDGLLIESYQSNGYAQIAVQAKYYFVFETYAGSTLMLSLLVLLYDILRSKNYDIKMRSLVVFVGILPLALGSALVLLLMHQGAHISSAIILPVCSLMFLASASMATDKEVLDRISG